MKAVLAAFLLLLSAAQPALAWGDEGHEIVGLIAAHYLDPAVKRQVNAILKADPDTLTAHTIDAAATWADKYRESNAEARQRTRLWHFVDIELSAPDLGHACFDRPALPAGTPATQGEAKDCVVDKIEQFSAELANPATDAAERTQALKFLLHLVGDLHQPLHAADDHDRGGNDKRVRSDLAPAGTLHHYWDTEFVEALGTNPHRVASNLIHRISGHDLQDWRRGNPADWALDSFQIAKTDIYGKLPAPDEKGSYHLPPEYVTMAEQDAAAQLSKAGVRLAYLLNQALAKKR
jgi:hypothetical protein